MARLFSYSRKSGPKKKGGKKFCSDSPGLSLTACMVRAFPTEESAIPHQSLLFPPGSHEGARVLNEADTGHQVQKQRTRDHLTARDRRPATMPRIRAPITPLSGNSASLVWRVCIRLQRALYTLPGDVTSNEPLGARRRLRQRVRSS